MLNKSIRHHDNLFPIYTLMTQPQKYTIEIIIYNAIARPKIPKIPTKLAPSAPLCFAALLGAEVELAEELTAELPVAACSETDAAEVALAAVADDADLVAVSESNPVCTAAAACARPPKPEYVCR